MFLLIPDRSKKRIAYCIKNIGIVVDNGSLKRDKLSVLLLLVKVQCVHKAKKKEMTISAIFSVRFSLFLAVI